MTDSDNAQSLRQALVDELKQRRKLDNPRIEAAFGTVPRHMFLPELPLEEVYSDRALPTKRDDDGSLLSSSSQPSMMILMFGQMGLKQGDNVLEIGAGTGYNAAIMRHIVGDSGHVSTIEIDSELAQQARDNLHQIGIHDIDVIDTDGILGYSANAPYDHILATVGIWDVPQTWVDQLKPGGRVVAPIWIDALQVSAAFRQQSNGTLVSDDNIPCGFITLRGQQSAAFTQTRVGGSTLSLLADGVDTIDTAALHNLLSDDASKAYLGFPLTAGDYWHGFMPYLMLTKPKWTGFVFYTVEGDKKAYGLEGQGFALVGRGSACFIPYEGNGDVFCFGGADAMVKLQEYATAWDAAGRPNMDRMRIELLPLDVQLAPTPGHRVYSRPEHLLHVWLER